MDKKIAAILGIAFLLGVSSADAGQLKFDGVAVDITTGDGEDLVIAPAAGGKTRIGTSSGTASHAGSNSDLYVSGVLENNGATYLNSTATISSTLTANSNVTLGSSAANTVAVSGMMGIGTGSQPITQPFQVGAGAEPALVVTASGNVGVGTTAPIARLHIANAGTDTQFILRVTDSNNVDKFVIMPNGNIGIGTTNPTSTLSVPAGVIYASDIVGPFHGEVTFANIVTGSNTKAAMVIDAGASLGYQNSGTINSSSLQSATWAKPGAIGSTTPSTGAFTTLTATTGTFTTLSLENAGFTALTANTATITNLTTTKDTHLVTTSGNVGIGTATPAYKLDVSGTVGVGTTAAAGNGEVSNGLNLALTDATTGGGGYTALSVSVGGAGTGLGNKYLLDLSPGSTATEIVFDSHGALRPTTSITASTASLGSSDYYFKSGYLHNLTANTAVMSNLLVSKSTYLATTGGNVGIGTTAPGYTLQVVGTLDATSITQGGSPIGSSTFTSITSGTNVTAQMVVGSSANLTYAGTGTIVASDADKLLNATWVSPGAIGSVTSSTGAFTALTANTGTITNLTTTKDTHLATTSGNVGIGTATPGSLLDIVGISDDIGNNASLRILPIGPATTDLRIGVSEANSYTWIQAAQTGGSFNRPLILNGAGGTIGVGNTRPGAIVHITNIQAGTVPTTMMIVAGGTGTNLTVQARNANNVDTFTILDKGNVGIGTTTPFGLLEIATTTPGIPALVVQGGTGGINIGIGTTAPGATMEVVGSVKATSFVGTIVGEVAFNNITSGTNVNAQMVVGEGAHLTYADGGAIVASNADKLLNKTWASPGAIGTGTPSTGAFTVLSASTGTITTLNATVLTADTGRATNLTVTSDTYLATTAGANVGIGTSTPFATLHIGTTTPAKPVLFVDATSGNVGIGTSGPKYNLQVIGTLDATNITQGGAPLSSAFSSLTSGTNVTAQMVVGEGAHLTYADGGAIVASNADKLLNKTWTAPGAIGSVTPSTGAFTVLSANTGTFTTLSLETASLTILTADTATITNLTTTKDTHLATSSGNVGIGTAIPGALLNLVNERTTTTMKIVGGGTGANFALQVQDVFGQDKAVILDKGNVGVGTTLPNYTLQVVGTLDATTITQGGLPISSTFAGLTSGTNVTAQMVVGSGANLTYAGTGTIGASDADKLLNKTWAAPGAIGSGTPSTGVFTNLSATTGTITNLTSIDNTYLATTEGAKVGIGISTPTGRLEVGTTTAGYPALFVSAGGNVGIGTTKPGAYSLYVNGDTYLGGITVTGGTLSFGGDLDMKGHQITNTSNLGIGTSLPGSAAIAVMAGNVGIGTTAPLGLLDIATTTRGVPALVVRGGTEGINIGIGTTAPGATMEVVGSVKAASFIGPVIGDVAFDNLTSGTNISAQMVVGSNANLTYSGTGTIVASNANKLQNATWAAPGAIGSGTPSTGAFTVLSADTGTITNLTTTKDTHIATSSGNVGIGTAVPGALLNLVNERTTTTLKIAAGGTGTAYTLQVRNADNVDTLTLLDNGNFGIGTTAPLGSLHIGTTNLAKPSLFVDSTSGNIGVGTSGPVYKVQVIGTLDATTITQGGAPITPTFANISSGTNVSAQMVVATGANLTYAGTGTIVASNADKLQAATWASPGAIGTVTPSTGTFTIFSANTGTITNLTTTDNTYLATSTGTKVGIGMINPTGRLEVATATAGYPSLFVNATGNVGIGTTNPGTYSLYVNGDTYLGGVTVTGGTLAFGGDLDMKGHQITNTSNLGIGTSLPGSAAIAVMAGNVGIGTTAPLGLLDIATTTRGVPALVVRGGAGAINVGIGTTAPEATMEVAGSVKATSFIGTIEGTIPFNKITAGTNDQAAMLVDTGASINYQNNGIINASKLANATWTAPGTIGSGTPNTGAFTVLNATTGTITNLTTTQATHLATTGGNVGIGTAVPGALFNVVNERTTTTLKLTAGGTSTNFVLQVQDSFGQDKVVIMDQGSVGIATTSPGGLLEIGTTKLGVPALLVTMGARVGIGTSEPGGLLQVGDAAGVGTPSFIVKASNGSGGNVGIATTLPLARLEVATATPGYPSLFVTSSGNVGIGTTNPGTYSLYVKGDTYIGGITVTDGTLAFGGDLDMRGHKVTNTSNLGIGVSSPGDSALAVLGGNVGIGTAVSAQALQVVGNADVSGGYMIDAGLVLNNPAGVTQLVSPAGGAKITVGGTIDAQYIDAKGNVGIGTNVPVALLHITNLIADVTPTTMKLVAGGTGTGYALRVQDFLEQDKVVILDKGNVGIGTTLPTRALEVAGTVKATTFEGAVSGDVPFGNLTTGSNVQAAMLVDTGSTINYQNDGIINASKLQNATWTAPGTIGSGTPSTGAFTRLTANTGTITNLITTKETYLATTAGTKVGIGISTPLATLHIATTTPSQPALFVDALSGYTGIATTAPTGLLEVGTTTRGVPALIVRGGAESINVGIGTSAPSAAMEVVGTVKATAFEGAFTGNVPFGSLTTGSNVQAAMLVDTGASINYQNSGIINASKLQNATWASPGAIGSVTPSTGAFLILTANTGTITNLITTKDSYLATTAGTKVGIGISNPTGTLEVGTPTAGYPSLFVNAAGNVGIGTTNPDIYSLYVNGDAKIGGVTLSGGTLSFGGDLDMGGHKVKNASNIGIGLSSPGSAALAVEGGNVGIGTTLPVGLFQVGTGAAPGLVVKGLSGNIGIGTTEPLGLLEIGTTEISAPALLVRGGKAGINIGIGTTAPAATMEVVGDIKATSFIGTIAGSLSFANVTTGVNNVATMTVDTGAAIGYQNSGIINASKLQNATWTAPGTIGSGTPSTGAFTRLTANTGTITNLITTEDTYLATTAGAKVGIGISTPLATLHVATTTPSQPALFVDATSGHAGIGTSAPIAALDVNGNLEITQTGTAIKAVSLSQGATGGVVNVRDDTGVIAVSLDGRGTNKSFINAGNFGIGTTNPGALLEVGTSRRGYPALLVTAGANTGIGTTEPVGSFQVGDNAGLGIPPFIVKSGTGNVGVGTTLPTARLEVATATPGYPALFVTTDGNVGIGTTNPGNYSLYVNGDTYIGGITVTNGTLSFGGDLDMKGHKITNTSNLGIGTSLPGDASLAVMAGNVGIGTTGPAQKLQVAGNVDVSGGYMIDAGTVLNNPGGVTQLASPAGAAKITVNGVIDAQYINANGNVGIGTNSPSALLQLTNLIAGTTPTTMKIVAGGTGTSYALQVQDVYEQDKVVILDNGNVGIGTTLPGIKLEVNGQVKITGGTPGLNKVLTSDANGLADWQLVTSAKSLSDTDGDTKVEVEQVPDEDYIRFKTANTERMYLDNVGNVMIALPANGYLAAVENTSGTVASKGRIYLGSTVSDGWESISFDPTLGTNGNFVFTAPLKVPASSPGITFYDPADPYNVSKQTAIIYNSTNQQVSMGDSFRANFSDSSGNPPANKPFFQVGSTDLQGPGSNGVFFGGNSTEGFGGDLIHFQKGGQTRLRLTCQGNMILSNNYTTPDAFYSRLAVLGFVYSGQGTAQGINVAPTMSAAANNDVLAGLRIAPVYQNGAYTGVKNFGLLVEQGLVGIGSSAAPGALLNVTNLIAGTMPTTLKIVAGGSNSNFALQVQDVNGINKVVILDKGNVGIGTTNPAYSMQVVGTLDATSITQAGTPISNAFSSLASGTNVQAQMVVGTGANLDYTGTGTIHASAADKLQNATWASPGAIGSATPSAGSFTIFTADTGTLGNFTATSDTYLATTGGNVGIGTTAALAALHVGTTSLSAPALFVNAANGRVGIGLTAPLANLHVYAQSGGGVIAVDASSGNYAVYKMLSVGMEKWAMYSSPNDLVFRQGGSNEYMRIKSNGKVGIGTSIPAALLDINNINAAAPTTLKLAAGGTGTNFVLHVQDAGGADKVVILDNGNLGIGTTSPTYNVQIIGSLEATSITQSGAPLSNAFSGITSGTNVTAQMVVASGANLSYSGTGTIKATNADKLLDATWASPGAIGATAPSTAAFTTLSTSGNVGIGITGATVALLQVGAAPATPAFVVTSAGNIGIGVTNPGDRLVVARDTGTAVISPSAIRISSTSDGSDWSKTVSWGNLDFWTADASGTGPDVRVRIGAINEVEGAGRYTGLIFSTSAAAPVAEQMRITSFGNVGIATSAPNGRLEVATATAGSPALFVTSNGKVGIGTTNPGAYSLYVTGDTYLGGITVTGGTLAFGGDLDMKGHKVTNTSNLGIGTSVPGDAALAVMGGNAGIGTETPAQALQVVGNTDISGSYMIDTNVILNNPAGVTQLRSPAAAKITVNGTTDAQYIDANGSIGIGTNSPAALLHLSNLNAGTTPTTLKIAAGGTGTSYALQVQDSLGQNKVVILDNGNLGVGTTAPAYAVQVIGTLEATTITQSGTPVSSAFSGITSGTNTGAQMIVGTGSNLAYSGAGVINASQLQNATWSAPGAIGSATPSTGSFTIFTADTGTLARLTTTGTTYLATTEGARVGIGTTLPLATLHVATTSPGNPALFVDAATGRVGIGTTNPAYAMQIIGTLDATNITQGGSPVNNAFSNVTSGTNISAQMVVGTGSNLVYSGAGTIIASSADKLLNKTWDAPGAIGATTPGTAAFTTLTASAGVGIGTTAPSALLNINNGAAITSTTLKMVAGGTDTNFTLQVQNAVGANKVVILDNGNLGVGTTAPAYAVQVIGTLDATNITQGGAPIGSSFSGLTGGTNVSAQMVVGTGSNLGFADSGTINASSLLGATWASPGAIGTTTPGLAVFTMLATIGNVGVGTTTPVYKLQVAGTLDATTITQGGLPLGSGFGNLSSGTNVTAQMVVGTGANLGFAGTGTINASTLQNTTWAAPGAIGSTTPGAGAFTTLSSTQGANFAVTSGNVGIGTTTPEALLNLINLHANTSPTTLKIVAGGVATDFAVQVQDVNGANKVVILDNGNVGVGTTAPAFALQVIGALDATTITQGGSPIGSGFASLTSGTNVSAQMVVGTGANLGFAGTGTINASTLENTTWTAPGAIGGTTPGSAAFTTLKASGNVGIGYTLPVGLLQVGQSLSAPGFIVTSSGNVGIGITNPASLLEVARDTGTAAITPSAIRISSTSDGSDWSSIASWGNLDFWNADGSGIGPAVRARIGAINEIEGAGRYTGIAFSTSAASVAAEQMRITSTGNLGIGTTAPAGRLEVGTTTLGIPSLFVSAGGKVGIGTTNPGTYALYVNGDTYLGGITVTGGTLAFGGDLDMRGHQITNTSNIGIGTSLPGSAALAVMNGSVGIGKTNPDYALDAVGSIRASNAVYATNGAAQLISNSVGSLDAVNFGLMSNNVIGLTLTTTGNVGIGTNVPKALLNIANLQAGTTPTAMKIIAGGTGANFALQVQDVFEQDKVVILDKGNVGIGTTVPVYTLQVIGTLDATTVTQGGVPIGSAFSGLTSGTNVAAQMVVGTGSNLTYAGSGVIDASKLQSATWAAPGAIGVATPSTGAFTIFTANTGTITNLTTTDMTYLATTFGNVGIGTTGPGAKLNVVSTDDTASTIGRFTGASGTTYVGNGELESNRSTFYINYVNKTSNIDFLKGKVFFENSGNVGIGTISPVALLNLTNIRAGTTPTTLQLVAGGTGTNLVLQVQDKTGVDKVAILDKGNVGVGTTAPAYTMQVVGSLDATTITQGGVPITPNFGNLTSGTNVAAQMVVGTGANLTSSGGTIDATKLQGSTWAAPGAIGATTPGTAAFTTLTTSGNVGIGMTNALAALQVGTTSLSKPALFVDAISGNVGIGTTGSIRKLEILSSIESQLYLNTNETGGNKGTSIGMPADHYMRIGGSDASDVQFMVVGAGYNNLPGRMIFRYGAGGSRWEYTDGATPVEKMRIDSIGNVGIATTSPTGLLEVGTTKLGRPSLFVSANGNVGIGTTDPGAYSLYVNGDTYLGGITVTGGTLAFGGDLNMQGNRITNASNIAIGVSAPGSAGLAVLSGNVGIGTTTPATKFQVIETSAGAADNIIRLSASGYNLDNNQYGAIQFYNDDTSSDGPQVAAQIEVRSANDGALTGRGGSLVFLTATGSTGVEGAAPQEAMRINYGGNVGIGTTKPLALLQITNGVPDTTPTTMKLIAGTTGANFVLRVQDANLADKVVILDNGNVGVGTTLPTRPLEVAGVVKAASFEGALTGDVAFNNLTSGSNVQATMLVATGATLSYKNEGTINASVLQNATWGAPLGIGTTTPASAKFTTLAASGNVGIGWTSPMGLLQVGNTKATPVLMVTAEGNVGIGTSAPGASLDVVGSAIVQSPAPVLTFKDTDTATGVNVSEYLMFTDKWDAEVARIGRTAAKDFLRIGSSVGLALSGQLSDFTNPDIFISTFGNVGIATSSPTGLLEIGTTRAGYPGLFVTGGGRVGIGTTDPGTYSLYVNGDTYIGGITVTGGTLAFGGDLNMQDHRIVKASNIGIGTSLPGDAALAVLGGNAGIGTTGPQSELEVSAAENPALRLSSRKNGTWTLGENLANLEFYTFDSNAPAGVQASIGLVAEHASGYQFGMVFRNASDAAQNVEWMRIRHNGNVGIGTPAPVGLFQAGSGPSPALMVTGQDGNVGIGTTAPVIGNRLQIMGGNVGIGSNYSNGLLNFQGNTNTILISAIKSDGTNEGTLTYDAYSGFRFSNSLGVGYAAIPAAGGNDLYVKSNVGVGTTAPEDKLHVYGGNAIIEHLNTVLSSLSFKNSNGSAILDFGRTGMTTSLGIYSPLLSANIAAFNTTTGNVGIGSSSPQQLLHLLRANDGGNVSMKIQNLAAGSGTVSSLQFASTTNANAITAEISAGRAPSYLGFSVDEAEQVRITATGNVGIGTTNPGNYKLYVAGDTYLGGVTVTNGALAFGGDLNMQNHQIINASNIGIGTTVASAALDITAPAKKSFQIQPNTDYVSLMVDGVEVARLRN